LQTSRHNSFGDKSQLSVSVDTPAGEKVAISFFIDKHMNEHLQRLQSHEETGLPVKRTKSDSKIPFEGSSSDTHKKSDRSSESSDTDDADLEVKRITEKKTQEDKKVEDKEKKSLKSPSGDSKYNYSPSTDKLKSSTDEAKLKTPEEPKSAFQRFSKIRGTSDRNRSATAEAALSSDQYLISLVIICCCV
jgi:hypothetical protein